MLLYVIGIHVEIILLMVVCEFLSNKLILNLNEYLNSFTHKKGM